MNGLSALAATRITALLQELRDIRELPGDLSFSRRYPDTPATDGEIVGRYNGNVVIADIVADDQKAVIRAGGRITLEQTKVPNIKHGKLITQEMIELLNRINAGGGIPQDEGIFSNYRNRQLDELLLGIRQTKELLLIGCAMDVSSWNVRGIQFSGVSWGMPSDLKLTASPLWTNAAGATPIDDTLSHIQFAREKYGESWNRMTLGSGDLRNAIATAEFAAKAQLYSPILFPPGSFPSANLPDMQALFGRVLNITVETYDSKYWVEGNDAALTSSNFLPAGKVILSDSRDDGSTRAIDFGNGIVTESVVGSLMDFGGGARFAGGTYGPVGYSEGTLNPPNLILWAVARGFPRKHRLSSTGVMTVA